MPSPEYGVVYGGVVCLVSGALGVTNLLNLQTKRNSYACMHRLTNGIIIIIFKKYFLCKGTSHSAVESDKKIKTLNVRQRNNQLKCQNLHIKNSV